VSTRARDPGSGTVVIDEVKVPAPDDVVGLVVVHVLVIVDTPLSPANIPVPPVTRLSVVTGSVHGPAPGKGAEQGSPGQDVHERPAGCERGQTGEDEGTHVRCGEGSGQTSHSDVTRPTASDADCKTALVVSKRRSCVQAVIRRRWRTQSLLETHVSVLPPTLCRCRTRLNR
jgi:hypothetical protein